MIEHSPSIVAIAAALLKFQGALKGVKRDSANPFFKSKYADLEQVVETAKPHLQDAGIAFLQSPGSIQNECLSMSTMLMHAESGEWIIGTGEIPLGKKDPQGAGSSQTYAQRYHLMAMLGLPPVDDDGESAMDRSRPADTPPKHSATPVETPNNFNAYLTSITSAKTLGDAQAAFAIIWKSDLSSEDKVTLQAAYEAQKVRIATPDFSGLEA